MNQSSKHPETLKTSTQYANALNEINRKTALALQAANAEREKSLVLLKLQLAAEKRMLNMKEISYQKAKDGKGAFTIGDMQDKPESFIQAIKFERQTQKQLAQEASSLLRDSGTYY